jgi:hypothetical protein
MPKQRKIMKKITYIVVLAYIILAFPESVTRATVDNVTPRSLTVRFAQNYDDLDAATVEIEFFKVAEMDAEGKYTALTPYSDVTDLIEGFETITADELAAASANILDLIETTGISADYNCTMENGEATADVEPGLYLVWVAPTKTSVYEYEFVPSMVFVPDTSEIDLKPERKSLTGDLVITKTLKEYNQLTGTPLFVFDVEAVNEDGETVFSDVVSLAFDSATVKSATVTGIPAGSTVTVTEVYSTAAYDILSENSVTVEIVADGEPATAEFVNDYNDSLIYATGVVNHFEVSTDNGTDSNTIYSWQWEQLEDNE